MYHYEHPHLYRLEQMTWSQVLALPRRHTMFVATFSPLEVHGPHLPLGQDMFEGEAMAMAAALQVLETHPDWHFVFLPRCFVACDTVPALGSVEFTPHQVETVAYNCFRSFAEAGFTRFGYTSFHGSPRHFLALETAGHRLSEKYGVGAVCLFSLVLARLTDPGSLHSAVDTDGDCPINAAQIKQDLHGGFVETSLGLHLFPELVDPAFVEVSPSVADEMSKRGEATTMLFKSKDPVDQTLLQRLGGYLRMYQDIRSSIEHFTRSTYRGYPAGSQEKYGHRLFEHLVGTAAPLLAEFLDKGREMDGHSPLWPYRKLFLNHYLGGAVRAYQESQAQKTGQRH